MRAHMNCIENLAVYAAVVVALLASGLISPVIDNPALAMLGTRMGQTVVHIVLPPTTFAIGLRFAQFLLHVACMTTIGTMVAVVALA